MSKSARKVRGPQKDGGVEANGTHHRSTAFKFVVLAVVGMVLTYVHTAHIATLFENVLHFSHLADFEREMAYRTEMGFYYSFYKTLIDAPSLVTGLHQLTNDNATEFGHTINALQRFNVYPEVLLAAAYRLFSKIANESQWNVQSCWQVSRGNNLPPVVGCEGIGNQHYFYVDIVFFLYGTVAASLFMLGYLLSDSMLGGLLTVCSFFFNHGEATRVHWTPPLRESFGYPVFILQILVITYVLRHGRSGHLWTLLIAYPTIAFILFWQFSVFALSTQILSLFTTFVLDFIPIKTMDTIIRGHAIAFAISFVLLFGNKMLLSSFYMSSILSLLIIISLDQHLYRINFRLVYMTVSGTLFAAGTVGIKLIISWLLNVRDDAHIIDLLRSKFTSYANFHTRLYTCAKEFDFLGFEALTELTKTLLIPTALLVVILFVVHFLKFEASLSKRNKARTKVYAEVVYGLLQCFCFVVIAGLFMRLKLFMTPHLCIIVALLCNKLFLERTLSVKISDWLHRMLFFCLLAAMAYQGVQNVQKMRSMQNEYSNSDQEALFTWVIQRTKPDAVFAGTMPVMANLKLSTGRAIVNHPHYEDAALRLRTLKVYSLFSRKPLSEVHSTLRQMGVNYFVYQLSSCEPNHDRPECSYRSLWDLEDQVNVNRESLCDIIPHAIETRQASMLGPLELVYNANNYIVFKF